VSNGDDGDRPITAAEAADLRHALEEIQQAQDELREASTARERAEAQENVSDAREDLDALASRLGISRSALNESIAAAKKAEQKEELRPIIAELLEETKAQEPEPAAVKAEPDNEPAQEHWSQRGVTELIRGG
jgi:SMC interacting uncharacterized protein involved in chromosome segregation